MRVLCRYCGSEIHPTDTDGLKLRCCVFCEVSHDIREASVMADLLAAAAERVGNLDRRDVTESQLRASVTKGRAGAATLVEVMSTLAIIVTLLGVVLGYVHKGKTAAEGQLKTIEATLNKGLDEATRVSDDSPYAFDGPATMR